MNMVKNISSWILFAALLMLSACTKDDTPAEAPTPVGFRAMSQSVMVKGDPEVPAFPYDDFGVWGIATEPLNDPYMLWNDNALAQVSRVDGSETFAPQTDAYWFTGYEYYFLALAPFSSGVTNLNISKTLSGNQLTSNPSMSFAYGLAAKYDSEEYDYDLLAAAQYKDISAPSEKPAAQDLVFWHLFSRIKIRVNFDGSTGSVQAIRLHNVDQDIAYSISPSSDVQTPAVACTNTSKTTTVNPISFTTSSSNYYDEDKDGDKEWYLSIVPQNISDFKMFLDFTTKIDGNDVVVRDYEIDLSPAKDKPDYTYNNQYNWNITIGPKQAITFNVTVTPWTTVGPDDDGGIPEIEIK